MRILTHVLAVLFLSAVSLSAQFGGELTFGLGGEPKNLHPLQAVEEPSEVVRYLTKASLIRINRVTQEVEPQLVSSWTIADNGRLVNFQLLEGLKFSDGTPFDARDVAYTFEQLKNPHLASPIADSFRLDEGDIEVKVSSPYQVSILFPKTIAGVERLFDPLPILSSRSPLGVKATLGPFQIAEYKPGSHVRLIKNPNFWRKDADGKRLPYLDSVRLRIVKTQQGELLGFRRGELDLITNIDPEAYERLAVTNKQAVQDAGASLDAEFLWFNLRPSAPLPAATKKWFASKEFRRAISLAINRDDLVRVVYRGHAQPAVGPISPANRFWFNKDLAAAKQDLAAAEALLTKASFRKVGDKLLDSSGQPVEFSLITNAGNQARERMAAMLQYDLKKLGIQLNIVTLDFQSLIERITETFDYELCMLGFVNVDLDPNAQMNVWMSSARNHAWNPAQESPATPWEARIDELVLLQAESTDSAVRRKAFNEVQQIVQQQAPIVYLVHKHLLSAVSPSLRGVQPGSLWPSVIWNIEEIRKPSEAKK